MILSGMAKAARSRPTIKEQHDFAILPLRAHATFSSRPVLEAVVVDKLGAMRRPGESYSDVILRLVETETKGR